MAAPVVDGTSGEERRGEELMLSVSHDPMYVPYLPVSKVHT
jgi:hypothetical protein